MLALAPDLVRQERMREARGPSGGDAIRSLVLDPATSWPWSSDDQRIAAHGVMGDAREASVEHGKAMVERVVAAVEPVLRQLLENQAGRR
jgi:creatinine amidohydrolase/Fe(II)-dependent formamide hydrolase-like protein